MPAWLAFAIVGVGQLVIFWVMRAFVRKAVVGEPPLFLRLIVVLTGIVAVLLLLAAAYLAVVEAQA